MINEYGGYMNIDRIEDRYEISSKVRGWDIMMG